MEYVSLSSCDSVLDSWNLVGHCCLWTSKQSRVPLDLSNCNLLLPKIFACPS